MLIRVCMLGALVALAGCEKINPDFDDPAGQSGTSDSTGGSGTSGANASDATSSPTASDSAVTDSMSGTSSTDSTTQGGSDSNSNGLTTDTTTDATTDTTTSEVTATGSTGPDMVECGLDEILADGPILYWRLGEAMGNTAMDSSGNAQHGTYVGATQGVAGVSWDGDTAIVLSGSVNSRVELFPMNMFATTEFTVEFWVRADGGSGDEAFISYSWQGGNQDALMVDEPGSMSVQLFGDPITTPVSIMDGQWHHVALTWQSSDGMTRLYRDGEQIFSTAGFALGETYQAGGALVLGQDQDDLNGGFDGGQALDGALDEVVIYDKVLSPARIDAHRLSIECPQ